jgi:hypothetical protein
MKKAIPTIIFLLIISTSYAIKNSKSNPGHKQSSITLGTYANPPRSEDGRVDPVRLIDELKDLHANTYIWVIPPKNPEDWEALKVFLPLAEKAKIKVWVSLRPPSEPPTPSPYGIDYEKWAAELATLSMKEKSLTGWSIDDFSHNQKFFTIEYLGKVLTAARTINPKFTFIPCCYYNAITPEFANNYKALLNGILFPYRAESVGANLKDPGQAENEINKLRKLFGPEFRIYLDIYATAHSKLGATTPEYVKSVLEVGKKSANGVFIYKHQDPVLSAEKYRIIKEGFGNTR